MVAISAVRDSNADLSSGPGGRVSVFVGGTSGIGRGTVRSLAASTKAPKVYLVGRSASSAADLLAELRALNPEGTFVFVEAQVSLLREVDRACDEIRRLEKHIDLLVLTAGGLAANGRNETTEGLDVLLSVSYYSRMRFIVNLIPLLEASTSPTVISVLGAGKEGSIVLDDLELKTHYSLVTEAIQQGTMNPIYMRHLAAAHPKVAFIYTYPGLVNTGLLATTTSALTGVWSVVNVLAKMVLPVMLRFFAFTADEAGERVLFAATDDRFRLKGDLKRLDEYQEDAVAVAVLDDKEVSKKVCDHTQEVYERILVKK